MKFFFLILCHLLMMFFIHWHLMDSESFSFGNKTNQVLLVSVKNEIIDAKALMSKDIRYIISFNRPCFIFKLHPPEHN